MRLLDFASTALLVLPYAYGQAPLDLSTPATCVNGLQIIVTRGTHQTGGGYGTLEPLADSIMEAIPNSAKRPLAYPAVESPSYEDSVQQGIGNLTAYIQHYVDSCPNVKLALVGFSQGAQVSLDAVCGWPTGVTQSTQTFLGRSPLPLQYRKNIVAVVTYGDPCHSLPVSFNRGNSTHDGIFPRPIGQCAFISNKLASWCDNGDQFCDACPPPTSSSAPNPRGCDINTHHTYWDLYNADAVDFVKQRYIKMFGNVPTASASPSSATGSGSGPTSTSSPGNAACNQHAPSMIVFATFALAAALLSTA